MPPQNSKGYAHARAQANPTRSRSSSPMAPSRGVESTLSTSVPVKSTSTTTKQPPRSSASTSTPEQEISATPITSTEFPVAVLGTGQRDAGRRETAKAIRLVWDSLESHLDAAAGAQVNRQCCNEIVGLPSFHRKCVKEYGFVIQVLSNHL
jgi:cytoskeletal protein RodZ